MYDSQLPTTERTVFILHNTVEVFHVRCDVTKRIFRQEATYHAALDTLV